MPSFDRKNNQTWMGRPIADMDRHELAAALKAAISLLQSAPSTSFLRSDVDVRETSTGTAVGRSFKWAFIPAGQLWSDEDRRDVQSRLDEFTASHVGKATERSGPYAHNRARNCPAESMIGGAYGLILLAACG